VTAILRQTHGGWRWRMAARELIESENVLALEKIRSLFNHFFRKGHKLLNQDSIEGWIMHPQAKSRLFGLTPAQYKAMAPAAKAHAKKDALEQLELHFEEIFQRRHDCIHNCDRPTIAVQNIRASVVTKKLQDIEFLVCRCHDGFLTEFPTYLTGLKFNAVTRNQVCI
jgi:hypothetical protein